MDRPDGLRTLTRPNVGCGYDKKPGYLNVDIDPACAPDLLIKEGDDSAIPRGHFAEAFATDVLEHIERTEALGALLRWSEYLIDRGALIVSTSSILGVAHAMQRAGRQPHVLPRPDASQSHPAGDAQILHGSCGIA
jgi:hypothetical protein